MNKLLLLALLGFALVAIAEEREEKTREIEDIQNQEIREADGKEKIETNEAKKRKQKKKKKSGKNAENKSGTKSGKTSGKKSGKIQSKKSGKKNYGKSKKASKKNGGETGNRKPKKGGKGLRKKSDKKPKGKGIGRKKMNQNQIRTTTCLNYTCIDTAIRHLRILKDRVANFEKQDARIKKQNKTGGSKAGKKGIFGEVIRRINGIAGGNSSNHTCRGKKNAAAVQLTNLTDTLLKCEDEIKNKCDPSNLPLPNITEVIACNSAISTFKSKTGECLKKTGSAACTCWDDTTIASTAKKVKICD